MIAEPYICIKGPSAGVIRWYDMKHCEDGVTSIVGNTWQPYADFERARLDVLGIVQIETCPMYGSPIRPTGNAYFCSTPKNNYGSVKEMAIIY